MTHTKEYMREWHKNHPGARIAFSEKFRRKNGIKPLVRKPFEWVEEASSRYNHLTPCWNCVSHSKGDGGHTKVRALYPGATTVVHRYLYEELFGLKDASNVVRHKCDNPSCINPEHWIEGSSADNMRDMIERRRHAKGESVARSRLKEADVMEIRDALSRGETQTSIARKYAVGKSCIASVAHRLTWKHI